MKKIWVLMLLALLLAGCAKQTPEDWTLCRLEEGSPDVYAFQQDDLWGLADGKKRVLIDAKFVSMERFRGDYAAASLIDYTAEPMDISGYLEYPRMYGVIDRQGKTVVEFEYTKMMEQEGGFFIVEKDEKWGLMNIDGSFILEPQLDTIHEFDGRYAQFCRYEEAENEDGDACNVDYYGLINDCGVILLPAEYDRISSDNGVITATRKGEISRFKIEGDQAVPIERGVGLDMDISKMEKLCDDPAVYAYSVNELKGLADAQGNAITEPLFFRIDSFRGGHAVATKFDYSSQPVDMSGVMEYNQLYGVIDTNGEAVLEFEFDTPISLSDDGKIVNYRVEGDFSYSHGYMNIDGSIITEPEYEIAGDFVNGFALVAEFEADPNADQTSGPNGEYYFGVIGTDGKPIIPLEYEQGEYFPADDSVLLKRDGEDHYFCIENGVARELVVVGDSFSLEEYYPFTGSKLARLDGEPTLEKRASSAHGHPRLDGATALFPVYSAIVEAVYPDETRYTADYEADTKTIVTCTKTNRAYERLAEGECDLIFAAEPSDAQIKYAQSHGVEFELTPFGREAFVFIVNSDNPLENITIEQIRGVYSGEITDWSDLGVENLGKIAAYQRPANSGSQTALEKLMGDTAIMNAPSETMSDFMDEVIEAIEYRNFPNAIGYTFRFFCTDMIGSDVKLLSINGIAPTLENIRNESYPACSALYMVSRKGEKNPNVQALIDWVLSEQGRELIEKSGYAALN